MVQRLRFKTSEKKILVVHGPNLNSLGSRETEVYGNVELTEINARLIAFAQENGVLLDCFQSNHEGALIDRLQLVAQEGIAAVIVNPGGLAHTSISLRDALAAMQVPFVEVHLTNIYAREPFRRHSHCAELAIGVIAGFGPQSYELALAYLLSDLEED